MVRIKYTPTHYPTGVKQGANCIQAVNSYIKHAPPVSGLFVIEALTHFANKVVADQERIREEMKNHIISPEYWIAMANAWIDADEFRNRKKDEK